MCVRALVSVLVTKMLTAFEEKQVNTCAVLCFITRLEKQGRLAMNTAVLFGSVVWGFTCIRLGRATLFPSHPLLIIAPFPPRLVERVRSLKKQKQKKATGMEEENGAGGARCARMQTWRAGRPWG